MVELVESIIQTPRMSKQGIVKIEVDKNDTLRLRWTANGKRQAKSLGCKDTTFNRKVALSKAMEIEIDILSGTFDSTLDKYRFTELKPSSGCLVQFPVSTTSTIPLLNLWDAYTNYRQPMVSPTTINTTYKRVRNHLLNCPYKALEDGVKVKQYLLSSTTPNTTKKVIVQLNACCKWAIQTKQCSSNPFDGLTTDIKTVNKGTDNIDPFTEEEIESIVKSFQSSHYYNYYTPFVKFLFATGCRTGEAIALRWSHVLSTRSRYQYVLFAENYTQGIRKATKNNKSRKFPVNDDLKQLLEEQYEITGSNHYELVFPAPRTGSEIDAHNFLTRAWKSVLSNVGVRYRPQYNTRHTFASHAIEKGVSVPQTAKWIGDSSETVARYYAGSLDSVLPPSIF